MCIFIWPWTNLWFIWDEATTKWNNFLSHIHCKWKDTWWSLGEISFRLYVVIVNRVWILVVGAFTCSVSFGDSSWEANVEALLSLGWKVLYLPRVLFDSFLSSETIRYPSVFYGTDNVRGGLPVEFYTFKFVQHLRPSCKALNSPISSWSINLCM